MNQAMWRIAHPTIALAPIKLTLLLPSKVFGCILTKSILPRMQIVPHWLNCSKTRAVAFRLK